MKRPAAAQISCTYGSPLPLIVNYIGDGGPLPDVQQDRLGRRQRRIVPGVPAMPAVDPYWHTQCSGEVHSLPSSEQQAFSTGESCDVTWPEASQENSFCVLTEVRKEFHGTPLAEFSVSKSEIRAISIHKKSPKVKLFICRRIFSNVNDKFNFVDRIL